MNGSCEKNEDGQKPSPQNTSVKNTSAWFENCLYTYSWL